MDVLQMKGIVKTFSGVQALKGVDFSVRGGEIHALLGANGAGKSTLMKILSGAYSSDGGTITIGGREVTFRSPTDAMAAGIHCVYQEVDTAIVPSLSVAENVWLDRFAFGGALVNWRSLEAEAKPLLSRVGLDVDPSMKAGQLSISQKQLLLIARGLSRRVSLLVLDEPTAPLSDTETKRLFGIVRSLAREGVASVFISHRLPEVFELCDRLTVLRDGSVVGTWATADSSPGEVVRHMLGRSLEDESRQARRRTGEVALEVRGLRAGTKVKGVDLEVRRGEVLGVAGLVGAGKTELSRLLFGADKPDGGTIVWEGSELRLDSPRQAVKAGIALVPEERRAQGVLVEESVETNLTLPSLKRLGGAFGWLNRGKSRELANGIIAKLGIVPNDPGRKVKWLSGGNQQKVAIGKWLPLESELYLFDEPTKGVDVGAKAEIFRAVREMADQGKCVVYFSCEIDEILRVADRVAVMSYGRIVRVLDGADATAENILYYASAGEGEGA
ncbi:sugar ABC transporter ATP-binding protein [Paenibacillus thermoaerophilus]|uniref:Sugar ABC transporter ATP-binding protein n=1 Tax=Paenibacillus thermoaerophilus TaxID=1215385 RepID=A0ABW2V0Q4_9BACL|nr:sugar ABC transporter ATP-binding protein [Paenibacillus thermoaerophilus]TMV17742.1 sugar ABC transporter ATP-binding protein [Paenibacillus thermoaerophilus]